MATVFVTLGMWVIIVVFGRKKWRMQGGRSSEKYRATKIRNGFTLTEAETHSRPEAHVLPPISHNLFLFFSLFAMPS
jgi:hypothetical protein